MWTCYIILETVACALHKNPGVSYYLSGQRSLPGDCNTTFGWKLEDNITMPLIYTNWTVGEPNCAKINDSPYESCVHSWTTGDYSWNDVACDWTSCAICQYTGSLNETNITIIILSKKLFFSN